MEEISPQKQKSIGQAAKLIREAKRGVVLTGAGISTPSGIPDFRTDGSGLWARYNPKEVASLSAFRYQPEKVFNWMRPLVKLILNAKPNLAHIAIARLEKSGYIKTVITQNIDTLHQKAGSKNVLEVHGSLNTLTCISCYQQISADEFIKPYVEHGTIPRCPICDNILKPDVVLFEEQLPIKPWLYAKEATEASDLIIIAGSSLEVFPVAGLPVHALNRGSRLIIINQTSTYVNDRAHLVFSQDVVEIIPLIAAEVLGDHPFRGFTP